MSSTSNNPQPSTLSSVSSCWHPTVELTWQWQIGNNDIDTSIEADVYDIDLYVNQSIIDRDDQRRKVIGYRSVGSWENWRLGCMDIDLFVIGKEVIDPTLI